MLPSSHLCLLQVLVLFEGQCSCVPYRGHHSGVCLFSSLSQHALCKKLDDHLFQPILMTSSPANKAQLPSSSASAPHASSWLSVVPVLGLGLHLDQAEFQNCSDVVAWYELFYTISVPILPLYHFGSSLTSYSVMQTWWGYCHQTHSPAKNLCRVLLSCSPICKSGDWSRPFRVQSNSDVLVDA